MESRDELIIFHACRCLVSRIILYTSEEGKAEESFLFCSCWTRNHIITHPAKRSRTLSSRESQRDAFSPRKRDDVMKKFQSVARAHVHVARSDVERFGGREKIEVSNSTKKSENVRLEWSEMSSGSISKLQKAHFHGEKSSSSLNFHGLPWKDSLISEKPSTASKRCWNRRFEFDFVRATSNSYHGALSWCRGLGSCCSIFFGVKV